jgi:endogenous inhibitor of DNA gyrase (YacG/DUF329 family)
MGLAEQYQYSFALPLKYRLYYRREGIVSEKEISDAARRLSLSKVKVPLTCAVCGASINGFKRGERAFCSARCRVIDSRRRRKERETAPPPTQTHAES